MNSTNVVILAAGFIAVRLYADSLTNIWLTRGMKLIQYQKMTLIGIRQNK